MKTPTHPFITYLESLAKAEDRGTLAALRRGLGQSPGTVPDMFRYVVPRLPDNANKWTEKTYYMIDFILLDFNWHQLLQPQWYIENGGLWMLLFIIFAETGLFVGFFLPGDSLLFVAGILSTSLVNSVSLNTGSDFFNLLIISALCIIAGILGNTVGYLFGRKIGPAMYTWRDRLLFKKKYLYQAHEFYEKHGGGAIVMARFLPIVRTFAPIVAGIVGMDKKKFSFYNIIGCIAWVTTMLFAGHYLNEFSKRQFNFDLQQHLEVIVIGIVVITTAPVAIKLFFGKKKQPTDTPQ